MKFLSSLFSLLKKTYQEWQEDRASRLAAALAYYTIFSLAPLLVIAIAVAGLIWSQDAVHAQVMGQVQGLVGTEGAAFVEDLLQSASNPAEGIVATIIGLITLFFGALNVFNELHNSLNIIWEVKDEKPKNFWQSIKKALIDRFLSFTMVLGIGFLLLVSLVVSAGLSATQEIVGNAFPVPEFLLQILNLLVSIGVITLLFAMMYKYLPDAEVPWRYVWLGAFATAVLFSLGKMVIGIYLGNSAVASSFGAAGSLVLLLLWVYYSAQILFFGAEFTQVYANTHGAKILPEDDEATSTGSAVSKEGKPVSTPRTTTAPARSYKVPSTVEAENRQVARFFGGLMAASFFSGIMTALWGRKRR